MLALVIAMLITGFLVSTKAIRAQSPVAGQERDRGLTVKVGARANEASHEPVALWAIIIGVSRYKYGDQELDGMKIPNLKSAADDAQAIYEFLQSPEGGVFRPDHIRLMKDEDATVANVRASFDLVTRNAKPNDFFVVYIAGHGALISESVKGSVNRVQVPYFLLYESDLRDPTGSAIKMDDFRKLVSQIPARKGMVLSDTCHSGAVLLGGRGTSEDYVEANLRYFDEMNKVPAGVGFISAAGPREQSQELDELEHGLFTYCLLDGLGGLADKNGDKKVTFEELVDYLGSEVPKLSHSKQHPNYSQTTVEVSDLALSVANYVGTGAASPSGQYGVLQIRTPDVDGVLVAIDDQPVATLDTRTPRIVKLKAGNHKLSFSKGSMERSLQADVEPGKSKPVEVNLTFSRSDDEDLASSTSKTRQLNVYFSEPKEPSSKAVERLQQGVVLFNQQKFKEAAREFEAANQENGGAYPEALVYLGRTQQSLGQNAPAIRSFEAALAARKSDYETEALLAEAKFEGGNAAEAATILQGIIKRHPNYPFSRVVYGDLLFARRDFTRAEWQLRNAIRINPNYPPAHLILSDVLSYQDSREKQDQAVTEAEIALDQFNKISQKKKSIATGLKNLSISHVIFGGGRYVDKSAMAEAHHTLAKALVEKVNGDKNLTNVDPLLDRARKELTEASSLAAGLADQRRMALLLDTSAMCYFLKGDTQRAIDDGEAAVKRAEKEQTLADWPDPHLTLASAYEAKQKFRKAAENLNLYMKKSGSKLPPDVKKSYEDDVKRLTGLAIANKQ
jgi:uncharacterized caspase-like protein/tetratricopeptide (TPR) repeat protein